jgi:hypothetical protein
VARPRARRRSEPVSRDTAMEALSCAICSEVIVNARVSLCGHADQTASHPLSPSPRNGILRFQDIIRAFRAFEGHVPRIRTLN